MVLIGGAVSLAWAVTATTAADPIFTRREFTGSGIDEHKVETALCWPPRRRDDPSCR